MGDVSDRMIDQAVDRLESMGVASHVIERFKKDVQVPVDSIKSTSEEEEGLIV